jgi:hypothetical protein
LPLPYYSQQHHRRRAAPPPAGIKPPTSHVSAVSNPLHSHLLIPKAPIRGTSTARVIGASKTSTSTSSSINSVRTAQHRTAPHPTAPHITAPHHRFIFSCAGDLSDYPRLLLACCWPVGGPRRFASYRSQSTDATNVCCTPSFSGPSFHLNQPLFASPRP